MRHTPQIPFGWLLIWGASALLALHPVLWLVQSWRDPAYGSDGYVFLALTLALAIWSLTSGPSIPQRGHGTAIALLLCAAGMRFLGQISAVNFIGGLALCIDAFALFRLARLDERPRSVSPFWLSCLFLLSLPVERLLQRFAGLLLQDLSASGSCATLGLFFDDLICSGTLLVLRGHQILVDLPCSGTASLMVLGAVLFGAFALHRPTTGMVLCWTALSLGLSVLCNSLRISVLAFGVVFADVLPFDVMSAGPHAVIGLITLVLSLAPVFIWFRPPPRAGSPLWHGPVPPRAKSPGVVTGGFVFCMALIILATPRTAWDVSAPVNTPILPRSILGHSPEPHALAPTEQRYFTQYGGMAQKVTYGPMGLTLVRTTSPLRHLHTPDECLRGLGLNVSFAGTRQDEWPSATYTAQNTEYGWLVEVTFAADTGFVTNNISAVIWHWLTHPGTTWTSYQRITPQSLPPDQRRAMDRAIMAAFDIPTTSNFNNGETS